MHKAKLRISAFLAQISVFLFLLFSWFFVHADVSITGLVQDPDNPVIEGTNPTYTITLENLSSNQEDPPISISISILLSDVNSSELFTSLSDICSISNGSFSCGSLSPGQIQDYQFQWANAPAVGDSALTFDVLCGRIIGEVPCGGIAQITTSVVAESVALTDIPSTAIPGETVSGTITIVDSLPITNITTDPNIESSVNPTTLPAGGGSADYSLTIPDSAIANEVITDTITITDEAGNITTIDVSVTVIAETVSVTEMDLTAAPGETATDTFTVVDSLPTTISTDPDIDSSVDPATLPAGGGSVEYSITIPSTATADEVITDIITITDEANKVSTISVSVTVTAAESLNLSGLDGLTSSEREVANSLDNACAALTSSELSLTDGQEALAEICNLLIESDTSTQVTAVKQMTPKQAPAQGGSSVEISQRQFDNITARMVALRSGATGISASGLTLEYGGFSLPISLLSQASETPSGGSAGEENTSLFGKLGFFINGGLSLGDKDGSDNELGFDFDTQGLTAGLDYRLTDQFIVGGAIGYVNNDTDFDTSRGNMDVDGYSLAVYSTYYHSEASYLDAIVSYGWNDFDSSRRISFSSLSVDATGDTDGTEYSISLGGGYDFNRHSLTFGPFARINYINADIDGYIEHTISGLELVYEDQDVESLSTLLGGQLSYAISTSRGVFTPQLRLEWAHEFKNDSRFIQARFLYDPTETPFRLSTDDPDRDYFNLGAGVSATFTAGKSGYIYYEALLGHENIRQHSLAAGVRFEF